MVLSALLLIAFVIAASATTHRHWEFAEPARSAQEINFFKNIAFWPGFAFTWSLGQARGVYPVDVR